MENSSSHPAIGNEMETALKLLYSSTNEKKNERFIDIINKLDSNEKTTDLEKLTIKKLKEKLLKIMDKKNIYSSLNRKLINNISPISFQNCRKKDETVVRRVKEFFEGEEEEEYDININKDLVSTTIEVVGDSSKNCNLDALANLVKTYPKEFLIHVGIVIHEKEISDISPRICGGKNFWFAIIQYFMYLASKVDGVEIPDGVSIISNNDTNIDVIEMHDVFSSWFSPDPRQLLTIQRFTKFKPENDKACFLFHGVGTGKTITSLSIMLYYLNKNNLETPLKVLIIGPNGLFRAAFLKDCNNLGIYTNNTIVEDDGRETSDGYVNTQMYSDANNIFGDKPEGGETEETAPVKEIAPAKETADAIEIEETEETAPTKEIAPAKETAHAIEIAPAKETEETEETINTSKLYKIEFTGYDYDQLFRLDGLKTIQDNKYDVVICDEAHRFLMNSIKPQGGANDRIPYYQKGKDTEKEEKELTSDEKNYVKKMDQTTIEKHVKDNNDQQFCILNNTSQSVTNTFRDKRFMDFISKQQYSIFLTGTPYQTSTNDMIDIAWFLNNRKINLSNAKNICKELVDTGGYRRDPNRIFKRFINENNERIYVGGTIAEETLEITNSFFAILKTPLNFMLGTTETTNKGLQSNILDVYKAFSTGDVEEISKNLKVKITPELINAFRNPENMSKIFTKQATDDLMISLSKNEQLKGVFESINLEPDTRKTINDLLKDEGKRNEKINDYYSQLEVKSKTYIKEMNKELSHQINTNEDIEPFTEAVNKFNDFFTTGDGQQLNIPENALVGIRDELSALNQSIGQQSTLVHTQVNQAQASIRGWVDIVSTATQQSFGNVQLGGKYENIDDCINKEDIFSKNKFQDEINTEDSLVKLQVIDNQEEREINQCYSKENLKQWIENQVNGGKQLSEIQNPLTGTSYEEKFIENNYPDEIDNWKKTAEMSKKQSGEKQMGEKQMGEKQMGEKQMGEKQMGEMQGIYNTIFNETVRNKLNTVFEKLETIEFVELKMNKEGFFNLPEDYNLNELQILLAKCCYALPYINFNDICHESLIYLTESVKNEFMIKMYSSLLSSYMENSYYIDQLKYKDKHGKFIEEKLKNITQKSLQSGGGGIGSMFTSLFYLFSDFKWKLGIQNDPLNTNSGVEVNWVGASVNILRNSFSLIRPAVVGSVATHFSVWAVPGFFLAGTVGFIGSTLLEQIAVRTDKLVKHTTPYMSIYNYDYNNYAINQNEFEQQIQGVRITRHPQYVLDALNKNLLEPVLNIPKAASLTLHSNRGYKIPKAAS